MSRAGHPQVRMASSMQGEDGQHYVVLEVIQSSSSPNGRGPNVWAKRVGRKLLEISEIGTVGWVNLNFEKRPSRGGWSMAFVFISKKITFYS